MAVSRRRFLEVAACAAPGALISARSALGHDSGSAPSRASAGFRTDLHCALFNLEGDCVLPESYAGFERGLVEGSIAFERVTTDTIRSARVVLIPGGVLRSPRAAEAIRGQVDAGATVVYESGAAYADAGDFASEQRLLAQYFGLEIGDPIDLWTAGESLDPVAFAPYVRYEWPAQAMVRDFSRVIPVRVGHTFAKLGNIPAAARVKLGAGEFVFLGSPLGPHLGCADREANILLRALLNTTKPSEEL